MQNRSGTWDVQCESLTCHPALFGRPASCFVRPTWSKGIPKGFHEHGRSKQDPLDLPPSEAHVEAGELNNLEQLSRSLIT